MDLELNFQRLLKHTKTFHGDKVVILVIWYGPMYLIESSFFFTNNTRDP